MAFPTTPVIDTFNRANEDPLAAGWVTNSGNGLRVVSNECAPPATISGTGDGATWNTSFAANQECYCTFPTAVGIDLDYVATVVRLQTATDWLSNHYELECVRIAEANNDEFQEWKRVSGVWTQLGASINLGVDFANGDQIGIRATGSTIEVFLNGVSKGSRTDSDITANGFVALVYALSVTDTGVRGDNFGGGPERVPYDLAHSPQHQTVMAM